MRHDQLQIRTLGSFIIERDGEVIETFLTRKTALLLVYIALNPGKHTREKLAALFWSETSDEQALKNLRTVLSSIRKNTPDAVQISRQVMQIGPDIWVDALQFEEGCDAAFNGNKPSLETMIELAKLYSGEFLSDLHIRQVDRLQDWIDSTRERLHQKYQQLLYRLSTQSLEEGHPYTALDASRQIVTLNPFWEAAQRQLMLILLHLGQSGEAQIQYERLVTLLETELATRPEEETVALYESIRSGGPNTKASLPRIVLPDIPYIPPKNDLAALRQMLDNPDYRLITLIGMAGVGKTMLAMFAAHERQTIHNEDVIFISLATAKSTQALPQIILNSLNIEVEGTVTTEHVLSELKARKRLLILDNYEHLLPETTLIGRILDEAPGVRLLVTSQAALNLRQEWLLHLKGLHVENNEALHLFRKTVERLLPHFDLSPYDNDIHEICAFLDGLPLGIVIAASQMKVLSPPTILKVLHSDMLSFTAPYQDMPGRHRGFSPLIDSVLTRLAAKDQQALMALALFPDSFTHEGALTVANMDMPTFIRLVDRSLIQRAENFRYRIHGVLRHVLLEQLTASGDRENVRQRLTAYSQQAGEVALRAYALEEAVLHFQTVLELMPVSDTRRGDLWMKLGDATMLSGDYNQSTEAYREAQEVLLRNGETIGAARAWYHLGKVYWRQEAVAEAQAAFERALKLFVGVECQDAAETLLQLADLHATSFGHFTEGIAYAEQALNMAERLSNRRLEANVYRVMGNLQARSNELVVGQMSLERALNLAQEIGDPALVAEACAYLANIYAWTGKITRSREVSLLRAEMARRTHDLFHLRHVYSWIALQEILQGRWIEAKASLVQQAEILEGFQGPEPRATLCLYQTMLCYYQGSFDQAEREIRGVVEMLRPTKSPTLVWYLGWWGQLLAELGHYEEALNCFSELETLLENMDERARSRGYALGQLAVGYTRLGERQRAAKCYDTLLPFQGQFTPILVNRGLALAALSAGNTTAAHQHFIDAEMQARETGMLPELALTLVQRGRLEQDLASSKATNTVLAAGLQLCAELKMQEIGRRMLTWTVNELGPGHHQSTHPAGLSDREIEVLRLVAQGKINREIAVSLMISEKTVARHLTNIFNKTGVENRVGAVAYAFRNGLN